MEVNPEFLEAKRGSRISWTRRGVTPGYPRLHVTDFWSVVFATGNIMPMTSECPSSLAHIRWALGPNPSLYKHGLEGL
jgi:hypothetical protein